MFRSGYILLLVATCCSCLTSAEQISRQRRVVNGSPYEKGEYTFHVSMWYMGSNHQTKTKYPKLAHFCGGSLVDNRWVLTAAHCFDEGALEGTHDIKNWRVYVGIYEQPTLGDKTTFYNIERIVSHKNYNSETKKSDIALVKLSDPVTLSSKVSLANYKNKDKKCLKVGGDLKVIGWGMTSKTTWVSRVPNVADLKLKKTSECEKKYNGYLRECGVTSKFEFGDKVLCASSADWTKTGAPGDSGGPLLATCGGQKNVLVGIVSYGKPACIEIGYPTVFTKVSSYAKWIQTTIK